ncbi:amidohydrolase family protein [Deinococcus humi]|uniref:Imidazolonepropionase-like amidohydrolase n=1 Tax=Deinococcus humi TaxID=662880 RepID=A0A7W8JV40_9DEIO|nr:amidohydrolase family protein [Deinococcus humi]MBB5363694.1 imidazolonepropionase-like amidohydrolase [Deinococcus humi]GGO29733.1 amidohydrolase [Deinococcus humi]
MPNLQPLALYGRLLAPATGQVIERGVVLTHEGQIVDVGPVEAVSVPLDARSVALGEATILPGLIDLHVHARPHYTPLSLEAGVTTIRDAAGSLNNVTDLRASPSGPRVFAAGPALDAPSSVFGQFGQGVLGRVGDRDAGAWVLETPSDAVRAVETLADAGMDVVKLYEQLEVDVYRASACRAEARGLPVMTDLGLLCTRGLDGAQVDALDAIRAGVRSIEHASGYALALTRLGGDPYAEVLDARLVRHLARTTVSAGVALVPTLVTLAGLAGELGHQRWPNAGFANERARSFEPQWAPLRALPEGHRRSARADLRLARALVREMLDLGGCVVAGTDSPAAPDTLPGWALHAELDLLVGCGMTPLEAVRAATWAAARVLGGDDLGQLRRGAAADLLVVRGQPDRRLTDLRAVELVMQNGVLQPGQHFPTSTVDRTSPGDVLA